MRRLANGRERDPFCACKHGPAVHTAAGECRLREQCDCAGWQPVPYVYDEPACKRCAELESALRKLQALQAEAALPVAVPEQRPASHDELHRVRQQVRRDIARAHRGGSS